MSLMLSVSGCRGIVGSTLTPEVAARFAGCFGAVLQERSAGRAVTVVVGRDGRAGGEMILHGAISGLLGAGCDVIDIGIAMTPTTAIMTDLVAHELESRAQGGYAAGMVLTASHNPQQWNGLKCLLAEGGSFRSAACAPPAEIASKIIARFKDNAPLTNAWSGIGRASQRDGAAAAHVERLAAALQACNFCDDPAAIGAGLRVAVDSINGSGALGAKMGLDMLGCERVLVLNADGSGVFPHAPEPTLENLSAPGRLCDVVRTAGVDVGFAQDPDADRLAIIDETGRYIGEEYTLALGAMAVLEVERSRHDGPLTLATNLSTSRMLDDVAARYGATVRRTAVGEANVVEVMKRESCVLGGEGNGGVIWPRMTFVRDSLTAMALTLWLMSPEGGGKGRKRRLSEIVGSIPSYAIEKRKVDLASREEASPVLDRLADHFKKQQIDRQDGVWVNFVHGPLAGKAWLHVRASNTEPIMRFIAEAPTVEQARALLDEAEHAR